MGVAIVSWICHEDYKKLYKPLCLAIAESENNKEAFKKGLLQFYRTARVDITCTEERIGFLEVVEKDLGVEHFKEVKEWLKSLLRTEVACNDKIHAEGMEGILLNMMKICNQF